MTKLFLRYSLWVLWILIYEKIPISIRTADTFVIRTADTVVIRTVDTVVIQDDKVRLNENHFFF